jgi:PAS domain S-box-containing protein
LAESSEISLGFVFMNSPTKRLSLFGKLVILIIISSIVPLFFTIGLLIVTNAQHLWHGVTVLVLLCLGSLGLAFMFARHVTRPIRALLQAVMRISDGDFSTIVQVSTRDELQELAVAFNGMSEQLRRYSEVRVDEMLAEKAKTEGIIYSSEDGIVLTDQEGHAQLINPKARQMLNLSEERKEDLNGRPIWSFVTDDRLAVAIRESIEGDTPKSVRVVNLSADAVRRFYSLSVSLVNAPEGSGSAYWMVMNLRNITAEKELDRLKDDFLQSLTHDLRSPMTAIRGYLQVLSEEMAGPITPEQKKMLNVMENASTKLLHIISNLLDSAKISAGKLKISLAETDLRQMAPPTVEILHAEAAKKKITLTLDMPDQMTPVRLDPSLIERVIVNLISNAIKFTPDGGFVTVKFLELKDRFQCQVIDTGPGIPPEFMDRMFKKFEQVNGTRGGTGLGLANCKNIVESHYGEIGVRSKPGEGSTFTFWIPKDLEQTEKGDVFRMRPAEQKQAA